jgi:translation initiation factor 5B
METKSIYRSPICSVLGHVDVGKTLFLDKLRDSAVGQAEPGGITQKIGVTYLQREALQKLVGETKSGATFNVPGIMFIDTPGHECFTAQRLTGVEISDLVIVLVDIIKGLEQQTIESLNLLQKSKTPCIIVLNKVDRIYDWKASDGRNIKEALKDQSDETKRYYQEYVNHIIVQCAEQELNSALYYKNKNHREFISMIPFSSKTGEGMPDLLMMISILCTKYLSKNIVVTNQVNTGFVIERMVHRQYGSIVSAILTDGRIDQSSNVLFQDSRGEIVDTSVKRIFLPDKGTEVKDKLGLESVTELSEPRSAVIRFEYDGEIRTGSRFYAYTDEDEKIQYIDRLESSEGENNIYEYEYDKRGVYLMCPTIGMLHALYNICAARNITVSGTHIGFVSKVEIIRANSHLEAENTDEGIYNRRYSVILAYGMDISKEMIEYAKHDKVRIFTNDVIYRLVDEYDQYKEELNQKIRDRHPNLHLPFRASPLPQYIFRTDNPILIGVRVEEGTMYVGQTILAQKEEETDLSLQRTTIGTIIGIQNNKDDVESANKGAEVCIKIDNSEHRMKYGNNFDDSWELRPRYTLDEEFLITHLEHIFV